VGVEVLRSIFGKNHRLFIVEKVVIDDGIFMEPKGIDCIVVGVCEDVGLLLRERGCDLKTTSNNAEGNKCARPENGGELMDNDLVEEAEKPPAVGMIHARDHGVEWRQKRGMKTKDAMHDYCRSKEKLILLQVGRPLS